MHRGNGKPHSSVGLDELLDFLGSHGGVRPGKARAIKVHGLVVGNGDVALRRFCPHVLVLD